MKGTIWEEGEDIRNLTYDWDDHIIKINNLIIANWSNSESKREAINNYTRQQA